MLNKLDVFYPGNLPSYRNINGNHPLLYSVIEYASSKEINFIEHKSDKKFNYYNFFSIIQSLLILKNAHNLREYNYKDFFDNIKSRHFKSQILSNGTCDLTLYHTVPMTYSQSPWIFQLESIGQLFHPFLNQGEGLKEKQSVIDFPIYIFTKTLLESENCRAIFTNYSKTQIDLIKLFNSEIINNKTCHIRPGVHFSDLQIKKINEKRNRIQSKSKTTKKNILFTNSWHDGVNNFLLRGGVSLLLSFIEIWNVNKDITLTLRTSLPDSIKNSYLGLIIHNHPAIKLIEERVDDEQLFDLFLESDFFYLGSCGMHTVSTLKAMACLTLPIISGDVGLEEYVSHMNTGIIIDKLAIHDQVYDEKTNLFFDDYSSIWKDMFKYGNVESLTKNILKLSDPLNHDLVINIQMEASRVSLNKFSFSNWRNQIFNLIFENSQVSKKI